MHSALTRNRSPQSCLPWHSCQNRAQSWRSSTLLDFHADHCAQLLCVRRRTAVSGEPLSLFEIVVEGTHGGEGQKAVGGHQEPGQELTFTSAICWRSVLVEAALMSCGDTGLKNHATNTPATMIAQGSWREPPGHGENPDCQGQASGWAFPCSPSLESGTWNAVLS